MLLTPNQDDIAVDPCAYTGISGTTLVRNTTYVSNTLYPSTTTGTYVLSQAFYDQQPPYTTLEALVCDYLEGRSISFAQINPMFESVKSWTLLEQFYYMPLLFVLSRAAVRGYLWALSPFAIMTPSMKPRRIKSFMS